MLAFGTKRCGLDMIQYIYYVSLTKRLGCRFGNLISSNWRLDTEIEIDTFMASLCLIVMLNPRSKVLKVVEKFTWYMVVAHDGGKVMSFGAFSIHDRSQGRSVLCVLIRCKRFDLCKTNCIHQDKVLFCVNNQPRRLFWHWNLGTFCCTKFKCHICKMDVCLSALTQLTPHDIML